VNAAEALAVVRTVCDAHLCNAATRHTIDDALATIRDLIAAPPEVDDAPPGNGSERKTKTR